MAIIVFLVLGMRAQAQWEIISADAKPLAKQTSKVSEDFWLSVVIRNTTKKTLYIQGFDKWYMIEAYIKSDGAVWERRNTGVDRKLEMIPVSPGEEIRTVRREAVQNIGKPMMFTFLMALSQRDKIGSRVLLGEFKIPQLPKTDQRGVDQPTTAAESKSNDKEQPKPDSKGCSQ